MIKNFEYLIYSACWGPVALPRTSLKLVFLQLYFSLSWGVGSYLALQSRGVNNFSKSHVIGNQFILSKQVAKHFIKASRLESGVVPDL